jgi:hypothetical protein
MAQPELVALTPSEAKTLAREIMVTGDVKFTPHAIIEMGKDDLQATDCLNILRGGVYNPPELEKNQWRYRVETARMCVVFAFESETKLTVVTAWRKKQ